MGWKFWRRKKADAQITHIIERIRSDKLEGYVLVKKERISSKDYDVAVHCEKFNKNIFIIGGARSGKTTLGELLCLRLEEKKVIVSFKRFVPTKRDFDLGYQWIDATQHLPNLFADPLAFASAFRTAFYADATSRGLMIDAIFLNVNNVMAEHPKNFDEFYKILDKQARRGNWNNSITDLIIGKMKQIQRATEGSRISDVNFNQNNIVIDLGNLRDKETRTFLAEYYLRKIKRIEEEEQRTEPIRVIVDEAWNLLQATQQQSIIGDILLQGAYYIHFTCISQNYTHLADDYRSHFGTIFCFRDNNDADAQAIEKGYSALFKEAVQKLDGHEFIDLKESATDDRISVFELRYKNLRVMKLQAKTLAVLQEVNEHNAEEEPKPIEVKKAEPKLDEKILETLKESSIPLYGYEIGKALELSPKEAGLKVKQPLRALVKEEKVREWKCQLRNKEITYYYLANDSREVCHNFMMREAKKKFDDWNIVFEATHGTQGADFVIEKDGRELSIECETWLKKGISDLQTRVAKAETIIVVPTTSAKEFYQQLFECKMVLIPELEETLKN